MRKFKTESKRLLDLMINSIYTNREIFLRELVSNASDALDKLYVKALQESDKSINRNDLNINIYVDEDKRSISIVDNGIGMNKEELESNLGTIAHSGSLEFKSDEDVKKQDEIDIIGQFGVGFYASFMVADKVVVTSKAYGDDNAWEWKSDGLEGYTIKESKRDTHGTTVELFVREDTDDVDYGQYVSCSALQNLVKRYSDYIHYPILLEVSETKEKPRPKDADDDYKPEYETVTERKTVNSMVPIWTKKKSEVTDEEYAEFYKANFHDMKDPLRTISIHAEGALNYDALLFIPEDAPYNLYSKDFKKGLALYSSGVLIMEKCEDLLPDCFGFVRGIIDSPDLSLNISREMLQHDRQLQVMERRVQKKIKAELVKMLNDDREAYEKFFQQFGYSFKHDIYSSFGAQKELLQDLLLFHSAKEKKQITLDEYVAAASEDQERIYFAAGDTIARLENMPMVRSVVDKGYDVLLCGHSIDEFCIMSIGTYAEKQFTNIDSGDIELQSDEEVQEAKSIEEQNADMFKEMTDMLGDEVTKVSSSNMLEDIPAAVTSAGMVSLAMEKYFQSLPDAEVADKPPVEHALELNPKHPIFKVLTDAYAAGDKEKVEKYTKLLYNMACFAEGLQIDNPNEFTASIVELML